MRELSRTPLDTLVGCFEGPEISPWWHALASVPVPLGFNDYRWKTLTNRQRAHELIQSLSDCQETAPPTMCRKILGVEECTFGYIYEKMFEPFVAAEEWRHI
jgi:hypothetical protein